MAVIGRFNNFDSVNEKNGIDQYDDMDKQFPIVNKTMKNVVDFLNKNGITVSKVTEPDYDTDGDIELKDHPNIHVTVTLDNDFYASYEIPNTTKLNMGDVTKEPKKLLIDINKYIKKLK